MNVYYCLFLLINSVLTISIEKQDIKIESRQFSFFPQNDEMNSNKRDYYESPIQNQDSFRFSNEQRPDYGGSQRYQQLLRPDTIQISTVTGSVGGDTGFGFQNDPNQNNIITGINYPNPIKMTKKRPKKLKQNYNPSYTPYPMNDPNNPYFQNVNYAGTYNMYHQQQRPSQLNPYNPNGPSYNPYISPLQQQQQQYQQQQQQYQQYPSSFYSPYTQQQIYANQYGNYRPYPNAGGGYGNDVGGSGGGFGIGNLLSNFYNNIRGDNTGVGVGGGPAFGNQSPFGSFGGQFGKAIEDISQFDDLQCVPKLVCSMVGNPRRQTPLPSFINEPTLTALISAVPSTSPLLVFGRAALLGLSVGERSCDTAYPKCPRNEDDLLYYLNNHRGGFFRFFNGGAAYGDDVNSQNYQNQQYPQQNYQNQYVQQGGGNGIANNPQQSLNLGALQGLADAINQSGGINLSNLGSNLGLLGNLASLVGTMNGGSGTAGNNAGAGSGLSQAFGNLLTGLVGSRFSRKVHKRSIIEDKVEVKRDEEGIEDDEPQLGDVEPRIINHKDAPQSEFFPYKNVDNTKLITLEDIYQDELKASKKPKTKDEFNFIFPNDINNIRTSKRVNFFPETNTASTKGETIRMVFPGDRTGTGNLIFDNEYFDAKRYNINDNGFRIGKILTGGSPQSSSSSPTVDRYYNQNYQTNQNGNRPFIVENNPGQQTGNPVYSVYGDRIRNPQNNYNFNHNPQIIRHSDTNHENYGDKIYVTNSQGKIEYYINAKTGEKKYI